MRRDSEPCHSGEQIQCSTKFIQSPFSTQQLEGQGNLACNGSFFIHQQPWLSYTQNPLVVIHLSDTWLNITVIRRNTAVGLCLFQNHSYLSINFTRHFLSCLKRLEIGIPDAEEVWKKKRKTKNRHRQQIL